MADKQLLPLDFAETTAPGTPGSGFVRVYAKPDGKLYAKDANGVEYDLTQSGGGGSSNLQELTEDPASPQIGQQWLLKGDGQDPEELAAFFGGMPLMQEEGGSEFLLSVQTSEGVRRAALA